MKIVRLGEHIQTITPKTKIQAKKFLSSGKYPVVSQEAGVINGWWQNEADVMELDKPVIVFGDHTRNVKYVDFDFVAGADGTKILRPPDDIDSRYLYYFLIANPVESLGYARHYRILKEMLMPVPSLAEQHRIVERLDGIFAQIDRASVLLEENIANTNVLKQSLLAQAFDSNSATHTHTD